MASMAKKLRELFSTVESARNPVLAFALALGIVGFCLTMVGLLFMRR